MNDCSAGAAPTKADTIPAARSVDSLVEDATSFLQSSGDNCDHEVSYISGTWRQFREYCEAKEDRQKAKEERRARRNKPTREKQCKNAFFGQIAEVEKT